MAHCVVLRSFCLFALCGSLGCAASRPSLADELANKFDQRISELEAKNRELEQQVDQLKVDSNEKDQKISNLQETLSVISTESKAPATQTGSSGG
ncbi:hypothetical protein [Hyalangium rubrum]|uniref:Lipoprotein n=1 Tax=Hyalangium rubrum TaxID=3103134 RepID=A0ABU5H178_9BACT|nr:hypothetical protein [Hyalangium sp. s54d21]MDY7227207.1 hypothetical protein [Hyalangium sp. s54d21]